MACRRIIDVYYLLSGMDIHCKITHFGVSGICSAGSKSQLTDRLTSRHDIDSLGKRNKSLGVGEPSSGCLATFRGIDLE